MQWLGCWVVCGVVRCVSEWAAVGRLDDQLVRWPDGRLRTIHQTNQPTTPPITKLVSHPANQTKKNNQDQLNHRTNKQTDEPTDKPSRTLQPTTYNKESANGTANNRPKQRFSQTTYQSTAQTHNRCPDSHQTNHTANQTPNQPPTIQLTIQPASQLANQPASQHQQANNLHKAMFPYVATQRMETPTKSMSTTSMYLCVPLMLFTDALISHRVWSGGCRGGPAHSGHQQIPQRRCTRLAALSVKAQRWQAPLHAQHSCKHTTQGSWPVDVAYCTLTVRLTD